MLVNNAGIQFVSPVEEFPIDKWDAIIAINLSSAFHGIRAAVPGMKERGWGRIINTASAHSLVASPFKSAYVAAKHGIAGPDQDGGAGARDLQDHLQLHQPRLRLDAAGGKQIPDTMKARNLTKEQVINDVLLAGQPTKEFVTSTRSRRWRCFCAATTRRRSLAPISRSTAAGPRDNRRMLHSSWINVRRG